MDWSELKKSVAGKVVLGASASTLTTYHLGGPVAVLAEPRDREDLAGLMGRLRGTGSRYVILGGGSNVLFADEGFDGVVIRLGSGFQGVEVEGETLRVQAGTKTMALVNRAREAGLGGLEFCAGIPGHVGGAVAGNAGAGREWIGSRVEELTVVTRTGVVRKLGKGEYQASYRRSSLRDSGEVLVEAVIRADRKSPEAVEKAIRESLDARGAKQPLAERSAGSVFKNPEGDAAGRLAEAAGMKGFRVGGARVSEKHANFIVSDGGTAHDVAAVMREVQKRARESSGARLEPEILPMGDWKWDEVSDIWWPLRGPVFFTA